MRVSAGLAVIGLSGKTRIHTLPPRFIKRVSAIRAASISRASNQQGSKACKPNSPKASVLPRWAVPFIRPRCCLRYLYRDGANNMASNLLYSLSGALSPSPGAGGVAPESALPRPPELLVPESQRRPASLESLEPLQPAQQGVRSSLCVPDAPPARVVHVGASRCPGVALPPVPWVVAPPAGVEFVLLSVDALLPGVALPPVPWVVAPPAGVEFVLLSVDALLPGVSLPPDVEFVHHVAHDDHHDPQLAHVEPVA